MSFKKVKLHLNQENR